MSLYPNINYAWGSLIVDELVRNGVTYFCIAPGSRSAPLTVPAGRHAKARTFVHFDERGLAFHALGYVTATKKPAVLICTSGTAAANFFPAIIEASKKKLPLIVLTADRPPELRNTGAVQTIDQVGLFGKYVVWQTDMPCPDLAVKPEFVLTTIDQAVYQAGRKGGVVHINCMFRDPLAPVDEKVAWGGYFNGIKAWQKGNAPFTSYVTGFESIRIPQTKQIAARINGLKEGIVVIGKIGGPQEQEAALHFADRLGWPVFADISSGIRLGQSGNGIIHYYDQLLLGQKPLKVDAIIHFGGRITSKRYYQFLEQQSPAEYIMVLNHALRNDPLHLVSLRVESTVQNFCDSIGPLVKARKPGKLLTALAKRNAAVDRAIEGFFKGDDRICEMRVARLVSQYIKEGTGLFLANSMPIRDMDMYADFKGAPVVVAGNRGASGIDGLIASAIGFAQGLKAPVTLMVGDLSALHDLNSLAMLKDAEYPVVLVVLNNGGGAIFSFLPIAESKDVFGKYFGTPHPFTFANAAAMFELNYQRPDNDQGLIAAYKEALSANTSTIIEVINARDENFKVHKALQASLEKI